jgi:hypothetical protein
MPNKFKKRRTSEEDIEDEEEEEERDTWLVNTPSSFYGR